MNQKVAKLIKNKCRDSQGNIRYSQYQLLKRFWNQTPRNERSRKDIKALA